MDLLSWHLHAKSSQGGVFPFIEKTAGISDQSLLESYYSSVSITQVWHILSNLQQ